ncbi:DUF7382 domain-containing protein [Salarchaeum japonicum]|uniref:DUF7382 domain-containing protein n=1 Tax=Salarchaeum japonicum TaxID=555573 RepID=A0AAV3T1P3_9EURY|nr:carboxypeptidase regulatory-like domain-containing protein [Salarchaeum japonicum]
MFHELRRDERAIEGLPVRLLIAFVVGVATLGVLLQTVSGVGTLATTELDVKPTPDVVAPGEQTLALSVVDASGNGVAGATVLVKSGTARLDGTVVARTNESGVATVAVAPALGANQADGTLTVSVKPPAGGEYVDRRGNTRILVVRGYGG